MLQSECIYEDPSVIFKAAEENEGDEMGHFESLNQSERWHRLVRAAKRALKEHGYEVSRMPGRGLANVMKLTKAGKTELAAIRTTQDRWFAFNPSEGGGWKTLDEVKWVIVAAVDKPGAVEKIIVHMFPATDVQQRFNASLQARLDFGYPKRDFAMWVGLDTDTSGRPVAVGSGIADKYKPIGAYSADELVAPPGAMPEADAPLTEADAAAPVPMRTSIADVLRIAREQIAEMAGVRVDAVTLELKIGS